MVSTCLQLSVTNHATAHTLNVGGKLRTQQMKYLIPLFIFTLLLVSCENSKISETPVSQFIGKWILSERGILEGIQIEIKKNKEGELYGEVIHLNDNKYVKLFMENGDKLITSIKRSSNFEFIVTEKKIASPLFSIYNQSTIVEYRVIFQDENKILLGKNGANGVYTRMK